MKLTRRIAGAGLGAALAFAIAAAPANNQALAQEDVEYILATASTGGTYHPVGVGLSTIIRVKLQPKEKIGMTAINSAGSGENVRLLAKGEAQFAIMQGLYGYYAAQGIGPVEEAGPQGNLRSITMLWQNVEQFVIAADRADTGTIDDILALTGEPMAFGRQTSGTIGSNRTILGNLGVDMDASYELFYAGYGPSAEALQNGQVVGISTPAGAPTGAITKLMAAAGDSVTPLSFTDEQAAKADGGFGLWTRYVIPAGTYPGQDADWATIAQPNFLAVNADVPEEDVYKITKTIYENLVLLTAIHPAPKAMSLEKAIAGLPAPLHPGAARYYREQGIEIPDSLIAE